jgi:hypothetical protein
VGVGSEVGVVGEGVVEIRFGVVEVGVEGGVGELPGVLLSVLGPAVSSAANSEIVDMIESGNFGTSTVRSGSSQQDPDSAACWQQKVLVFAQKIRLSHLLGVSTHLFRHILDIGKETSTYSIDTLAHTDRI